MKTGIDVSHHQGVINWERVAQQIKPEIDFVFIKASQGVGSMDPRLKLNSVGAKTVGLKVGYYHYSTLNSASVSEDARSEAEWFVSVIKELPVPDLPLILDLEDDNKKVQLSKADVLRWVDMFFNTLIKFGYRDYALYSYTPFLEAHLPSNHNLGDVRLWIAAYTNKPEPKLPAGWKDFWCWQYTDKGTVNGISGAVDMNRMVSLGDKIGKKAG